MTPINSGNAGGASKPARVYRQAFTGQSTSVIFDPALVPASLGDLYLVNAYLDIRTAATSGTLACNVQWQDESGTHSIALIPAVNDTVVGNSGTGTKALWVKATGNITLSTVITGTPGPLVYDIYFEIMVL